MPRQRIKTDVETWVERLTSNEVYPFKLTKRQLVALTMMRDNSDKMFSDEDGEMVKEGRVVMVDQETFSPRTFFALVRHMAISESDGSETGRFERWHINETGKRILKAVGR
jgi:hypothetical protein